MSDFLEMIKERPLVTYGAVGSLMVERGFDLTGCLGKPNAESPVLVAGTTQWPVTPQEFATEASMWVEAGARVVGGAAEPRPFMQRLLVRH